MSDAILWGVGRNGTSLLTALLNRCVPGILAFNEMEQDRRAAQADLFFRRMRHRLETGVPVENRFDKEGHLATNPYRTGARSGVWDVGGRYTDKTSLVHKYGPGALEHCESYLSLGLSLIFIVRDPVFNIAAWNVAAHRGLSSYRLTDEDMHPIWKQIRWREKDRLGRQCELWEDSAARVVQLAHKHSRSVAVVSYEDLIDCPAVVLRAIADLLDAGGVTMGDIPVLNSANVEERYPDSDLSVIRDRVRALCPTRSALGYGE